MLEFKELMDYKNKRELIPYSLGQGFHRIEEEVFKLKALMEEYKSHIFTIDELKIIREKWDVSNRFLYIDHIEFSRHKNDICLKTIKDLDKLITFLEVASSEIDPRTLLLRDFYTLKIFLKNNFSK